MADDPYSAKLQSLQKHVPFIESMISSLRDPKKNRDAQLTKMEALHCMITDTKKRYKLETLNKCEEVIMKLQAKVANPPSKIMDKKQEMINKKNADSQEMIPGTNPPNPFPSGRSYDPPVVNAFQIMNALKLNVARVKLNNVQLTPKSPSPEKEIIEFKPKLIPTDKVPRISSPKTAMIGDDFDDYSSPRPVMYKERPSIYSSAAESLTNSPQKIGFLNLPPPVLPDISKPPLSIADLELLETTDDIPGFGLNAEDNNQKKAGSKYTKEIESKLHCSKPSPIPSSKPKSPRGERIMKESNHKSNKLPNVEPKSLEDVPKVKENSSAEKKDVKLEAKESNKDKQGSGSKDDKQSKSKDKKAEKRDKEKKDKTDADKSGEKKVEKSDASVHSVDKPSKSKDPRKPDDSSASACKSLKQINLFEKLDGFPAKKPEANAMKTVKPAPLKSDDDRDKGKNDEKINDSGGGKPAQSKPEGKVYERLADKYVKKPRKNNFEKSVGREVSDGTQKNSVMEPKIPFLGSPSSTSNAETTLEPPNWGQRSFSTDVVQNLNFSSPPLLQALNNLNPLFQNSQLTHSTYAASNNANMGQNLMGQPSFPPSQNMLMPNNNNMAVPHSFNDPMAEGSGFPASGPFGSMQMNQKMFSNTINVNQNIYIPQSFPQQRSFNPFDPIENAKANEYDLSQMPPVDFYNSHQNQPPYPPGPGGFNNRYAGGMHQGGYANESFNSGFGGNQDFNRQQRGFDAADRFQRDPRLVRNENMFQDHRELVRIDLNRGNDLMKQNPNFNNPMRDNNPLRDLREMPVRDPRDMHLRDLRDIPVRDPREFWNDDAADRPRNFRDRARSVSREDFTDRRERAKSVSREDSNDFRSNRDPRLNRDWRYRRDDRRPFKEDSSKFNEETGRFKKDEVNKNSANKEEPPSKDETNKDNKDESSSNVKEDANKTSKEETSKNNKEDTKKSKKEDLSASSKEDPNKANRDDSSKSVERRSRYDDVYSKLDKNKQKESFSSPLDSLYVSKKSTTGKGYGFQNFKIPKKPKVDGASDTQKNTDESKSNENTKNDNNETREGNAEEAEETGRLTLREKLPRSAKAKRDKNEQYGTTIEDETLEEREKPVTRSRLRNKVVKVTKEVGSESEEENSEGDDDDTPLAQRKSLKEHKESEDSDDEIIVPKKKKEISLEILENILTSKKEKNMDGDSILKLIKSVLVEQNSKKYKRIKRILYSSDESGGESDVDSGGKTTKTAVEKEKKLDAAETTAEATASEPAKDKKKPAKRKKKGKKAEETPESEPSKKQEEDVESVTSETIDDTLIESVGEKINSRKDAPAVTKKHRRSELDKLHEDIKEMLMGNDIFSANTKRICTQNQASKEETAEVGASKRTDKKSAPVPESPRTRASNLRVVIEKINIHEAKKRDSSQESANDAEEVAKPTKTRESKLLESPEGESPAPPSRLRARRKSVARGLKENSSLAESDSPEFAAPGQVKESEEGEELDDKKSKVNPKNRKKRPGGAWAQGIIKKKKKSGAKSKEVETSSEPADDMSSLHSDESEAESFVTEESPDVSIEPEYVEPTKDYYFTPNKKSQCKLCSLQAVNLTNHYRNSHPNHEVFISRLSPESTEEAVKEGLENDYNNIVEVETMDSQNRRSKFGYQCRFCQKIFKNSTTEVFYEHLTVHTGEYRYHCANCTFKTPNKKCLRTHLMQSHNLSFVVAQASSKPMRPLPPNCQHVFGYVCGECNFLQTQKHLVVEHFKIYHENRNIRVSKISMSCLPSKPTQDNAPDNEETDSTTLEPKDGVHLTVNEPDGERAEEAAPNAIKKKARYRPGPKSKKATLLIKEEVIIKPEIDEQKDEANGEEENPESPPAPTSPPPAPKKPDMTVFMCDTDILKENQNIDEDRRKKMEQINESIKVTRKSIADRLQTRLDTSALQSEPSETLEPKKPAASDLLPSECLASKELDEKHSKVDPPIVTSENDQTDKKIGEEQNSAGDVQNDNDGKYPKISIKSVESLNESFVKPSVVKSKILSSPKRSTPISNIINRLQDQLQGEPIMIDMNNPPPLMPISDVATKQTKPTDKQECVVQRLGPIEIRLIRNSIVYSCFAPTCVYRTPMRRLFEIHCNSKHVTYMVNIEKCDICQVKIEKEGEYVTMLDVLKHLTEVHLPDVESKEGENRKQDVIDVECFNMSPNVNFVEAKEGGKAAEEVRAPESRTIAKSDNRTIPSTSKKIEDEPIVRMAENSPFSFKITNVISQAAEIPSPKPLQTVPLLGFVISNVVSLAGDLTKSASSPSSPVQTPILPVIKSVQSLAGVQSPRDSPRASPAPLQVSSTSGRDKLQVKRAERVIMLEMPMKPEDINLPRKSQSAIDAILNIDGAPLYKCPDFNCSYAINSRKLFEAHLAGHSQMASEQVPCFYCNFKTSLSHVSQHVTIRHGTSKFTCGYCFYRGVCSDYVKAHHRNFHKDKKMCMIVSTYVVNPLESAQLQVQPSPLKTLIKPYVCGHPGCHKKFLCVEDYMNHMAEEKRLTKSRLKCYYCNYLAVTPVVMARHQQKHDLHMYHCRYCSKGDFEVTTVFDHQSLDHSMYHPQIVVRQLKATALETDWRKHDLNDDRLFEQLVKYPDDFKKGDITYPLQSDNSSIKELLNAESDSNSSLEGSLEEVAASRVAGVESPAATEASTPSSAGSGAQPTPLNKEYDPIILNRLLSGGTVTAVISVAQVKQDPKGNTTFIIPTPDQPPVEDKDPLSLDPVDIKQETREEPDLSEGLGIEVVTVDDMSFGNEDSNDNSEFPEDIGKKSNLQGTDLFKCGNCCQSFTTSVLLRQHINSCCRTSNSDGKPFKCPHCPKSLKHVATFIDHIRVHGTSRFCCSLCDFKHPHQLTLKAHMKAKHKVHNYKMIPFDATKADLDKDVFVMRPVLKRKSVDVPGGTSKENLAGEEAKSAVMKTTFHPSEMEQLPIQSIYSQEVHCALCEYKSKVKLNMVKHFQLHLSNKLVSESAPVNPVPCLEKNEKMFDKMTNLAASSHIINGRMGGKSEKPTKEEDEGQHPEFIPTNRRFVCGVGDCTYLTLDEVMLGRHLMALHADESSYKCKHCDVSISFEKSMNMDAINKHLRLHDLNLYKCGYCSFLHHVKNKVEKHLSDKHLEKPFVKVLRELTNDVDVADTSKEQKPWKCGICKFKCSAYNDVLSHVTNKHDVSVQYKCALCTFNSGDKETFSSHFEVSHPGHVVDVIDVFYKEEDQPQKSEVDTTQFDTTPLWSRDSNRVKHIRGILLEEPSKGGAKKNPVKTASVEERSEFSGPAPKKPKLAAIDNLLKSIESVAVGEDSVAATTPPVTTTTKAKKLKAKEKTTEKPVDEEIINIEDDEDDEVTIVEPKGEPSLILTMRPSGLVDEKPVVIAPKMLQQKRRFSDAELISAFGPFGEPTGALYTCPICKNHTSTSSSDFISHLYTELKYSKYVCSACGFKDPSVPVIQRHITSCHDPEVQVVETPTPDHKIETWARKVLVAQENIINSREDDEIDITVTSSNMSLEDASIEEPISLIEVSNLTSSSSPGKNTKTNFCKYCDYSCRTVYDLKKHEKRHWAIKPFKCGYCPTTGVTNYELTQHMKRIHPGLPVLIQQSKLPENPEIIPITRKRKQTYSETNNTEKELNCKLGSSNKAKRRRAFQLKCFYCNLITTKEALQEHHYKVHPDLDFSPYRYSCKECAEIFERVEQVKEHYAEHHPDIKTVMYIDAIKEANIGNPAQIQDEKPLLRFKCPKCLHTSNNFYGIREHIRTHIKPFHCGHCGHYFCYPHLVTHHSEKKHPGLAVHCVKVQENAELVTELQNCLLELSENGVYEPMKTKRGVVRKDNSELALADGKVLILDEDSGDELLMVSKVEKERQKKQVIRTMPAQPPPKQTARKSTGGYHRILKGGEDGFSFYGQQPEVVNLKALTTNVEIAGTSINMGVDQFANIFNLFPKVTVVDCKKADCST